MTHVTCRLTAKNRDQLRNPTIGNQVWATLNLFYLLYGGCRSGDGDTVLSGYSLLVRRVHALSASSLYLHYVSVCLSVRLFVCVRVCFCVRHTWRPQFSADFGRIWHKVHIYRRSSRQCQYTLYLRRRYTFYVMNVIVPCILLSALAPPVTA